MKWPSLSPRTFWKRNSELMSKTESETLRIMGFFLCFPAMACLPVNFCPIRDETGSKDTKKRYGVHTVLSCLSESCSLAAKCFLTVPLFSYSGLSSKERKRALARINTAEYSIRPLQANNTACCTGVHAGAYQQPGVFTSHWRGTVIASVIS